MKKIKLLWVALLAIMWTAFLQAESVSTTLNTQPFTGLSGYPTGWAATSAPAIGANTGGSIAWTSDMMTFSAGSGSGNRGFSAACPSTGTATMVTVSYDFEITVDNGLGYRNALGVALADASGNAILCLYACGNDAKWHYWNQSPALTVFSAATFNNAGADLATTNTLNSATQINVAYAKNVWYTLTATLDFTNHKVVSMSLTKSGLAAVTVSNQDFLSASASNLNKITAFDNRSSNQGNGSNGAITAIFDNFVTGKITDAGTISNNGPQCYSTGVTVSTTGSAPSGETFYWQASAAGTSTSYPTTSTYNVNASGTYYLRSYTTTGTLWSTATAGNAVTVYPLSVGGTATAVDATVPDAHGTVVNLTGNTGSTIQWQVSTNGVDYTNVSGGSGATTASYTTQNLTGGTTYSYKALVTSGNCSTTESSVTTVSAVSSNAVVTVGTLSGSGTYGKVANGSTSSSQSFTVEGSQLAGSITIHPPTGFELSSDNISFSSSNIVLTNSGTVTSTTIYARFAPAAVQAYTYTSSNGISVASTNVSTQYLNVTGTGIAAEPSTQTSAAGASSVLQTSMTFGWTVGSGAKSIVLYSTNSDVATAHVPVDGTTYTAGTEIATGYNVLYIGTGNSAGLSSLTAATTYYFAVFTFDDGGIAGSENYKTSSPATLTQATLANSNATDYFKSGATGDWSTIATWLSSTDNSSWHIATMIPQSNSTGVLVSAANPVLITSTSLTQGFSMENDATVSVEPGGSTGYGAAYNFTNTIAGSGSAVKIKSFTSSSINNNSIGYSPTISNISTLNMEMNVAGAIKGTNWGTCFGAVLPSGTQLNVTSTVGSAGFATLSDGILTNYKVNLGANVRLFKNYNQNSSGGHSNIVVGEITGASTSTIEGGFITARYLDYTIGGANTDATFDGKFKNYVAGDLLEIFKVGSGNWTLTGNSTGFLTGLFTVSAGKVTLNSGAGLGSVPVTVASGATLQGAGSIGGAATISAGATLNGSLNFGSTLSLAGTTNLTVTNFSSTYDVITTTGAVTNGGTLNITVSASAPAANTSIKLINSAGGYSGSFSTVNIKDGSGTSLPGYTYNATTGYLSYLATLSTQVSSLSVTSATQTSANLSWTAGDGAKTLVLYSTNSDVATAHVPVGATAYTLGQEIATGYFVGFAASGTSATISGLSAGTQYYFAAFSFNDYNTTGLENYLTASPATANTTTPANSNATDYFKSNVSGGDWSTATNWLSSADNSSWHLASMEPQATSTGVLVTAAYPVLITSTSMSLPFTMEDNATISLEPGGATSYNGNFTASNAITGNGGAITIKNYTASTTGSSSYSIYCSPIITNISTLNYELDIAGSKGSSSTRWSTSYGATVPSGTQVNVTSTVGSAGFALSSDVALANAKVNLGDNVRLLRNYNQASSSGGTSTISIGELSGNSSTTIEGGFVNASNRILAYEIGSLSSADNVFDGTFKNYSSALTAPLKIYKKGTKNWTLTGNSSSFTQGSFTVDAGTVTLASGASLGSGTIPVTVTGGATLVVASGATLPSSITVNVNNNGVGHLNIREGSTIASFTVSSTSAPAVGTELSVFTITDPSTITYTATPTLPVGYSYNATTGVITYNGTTTTGANTISALTLPSNATVQVNDASLTVDQTSTLRNLTLVPSAQLNVASGKTLTVSTLNLQSDATGTATFVNNGTAHITTANVQQYLTSGRNWYISSPVNAAPISALSSATSVQFWNEPVGAWSIITDGNLNAGYGYVSIGTASIGNVTFNGTLNDGDITVNLTRTKDAIKTGFNLVGNPYPSYLNWDAAYADAGTTNLGTTIWYRTKNTGNTAYVFDTYNITSQIGTGANGTVVTGNIPPLQAFWVRVNAAGDGTSTTGAITFKNTMRAHKGSQLQGDAQTYTDGSLRAPSMLNLTQQVLRLQVSNGTNMDETVMLFNANASNGIDGYDSEKMNNNSASVPEIYTTVGAEQLAINGLNSIPYNTELPLGFTTLTAGTFSIKASQISNFAAGTQVILRDKTLNYEQDLTAADYSFTSDVTSSTSRFTLVFKAPSVATGLNAATISTWITTNANNELVINGNANGASLDVFNAIGQRIVSKNLNNTSTRISLEKGVYMVTMCKNGQTVTQKVIMH